MLAMASLYTTVVPLVAVLLCAANVTASDRPTGGAQQFAANAAVTAPERASVAPTPSATTIIKAPDGLFYVTATIKGTDVRFLVDTGANLVVLTPEDARRIGVSPGHDGAPGHVETAAGQAQMDRVSLDEVRVAGRDVHNIDAAVMRDGLKVSLLGQNLLSRLGPITMSGDEITLQQPR